MPTHYSDDYTRLTGNPVPEDAQPRLAPEPLNNRVKTVVAESEQVQVIATVPETKDVKPADADTK